MQPGTDIVVHQAPALARGGGVHPEQKLIDMWLDGKSPHTQRACRADWREFRQVILISVGQIDLADLQTYARWLAEPGRKLALSSQRIKLLHIKSLFSFLSAKVHILKVNVGAALRVPEPRETLNERIISEQDVRMLLAAALPGRNRLICHLLYYCGLRNEELRNLRWKDCRAVEGGGELSVFGKGRKTRPVAVIASVWKKLMAYRKPADQEGDAIFPVCGAQICRIVHEAARRAGINPDCSPHWLRHCFVSHFVNRGGKATVAQKQAGHKNLETTMKYIHTNPGESVGAGLPPPEEEA